MKSGVIFIVIFSIILLYLTPAVGTNPSWGETYCEMTWSDATEEYVVQLTMELEIINPSSLGITGCADENTAITLLITGPKGAVVIDQFFSDPDNLFSYTAGVGGPLWGASGKYTASIIQQTDDNWKTNDGAISKSFTVLEGNLIKNSFANRFVPEPGSTTTSTATNIVENAQGSSVPGCEPNCFIPATIRINPGEQVTFNNNDSVAHTTTSVKSYDSFEEVGDVWDSSLVMSGVSYTTPALSEGVYPYFCMVHPWMEGTVLVYALDDIPTPPITPQTPPASQLDSKPQNEWTDEEHLFDEKSQVDKLQQKLDEYVNCVAFLISSNKDCIKQDGKYTLGGIDEVIRLTSYAVNTDNTIENPKITDDIPSKLEKFSDVTLHNKLVNSYNSVTTNDILNEIAWFYITTDDYGGLEAASVFRPHEERYFHVNIDVVDAFPDGHNFDKQFMIATFIHENGHIISLKSDQGDGNTVSSYDVDFITKEKKNREKCEPQFYTYDAGCMYENSYLNQFYHEYWDNIYDEWSQKTNYGLDEEGIYDFYQKYKLYFVTDYAAKNPEEDFAESFMMFVLKDKISPSSIAEQKISFFYKFEELVDIRNFIRTAIATDEFCNDGTVWSDEGKCIVEKSEEGGGCLIATAAFGSEMAPQVQFLREIRDNTVLQTTSGTAFMTGFNQFYYSFSPAIADYERENPVFKEAVKVTLTPMLTSLTLLNYVDVDTEEEMLGYGIGIILLNIGMYFVTPAVLIVSLKKRLFI